MDLENVLVLLREERDRLDTAIRSLECLGPPAGLLAGGLPRLRGKHRHIGPNSNLRHASPAPRASRSRLSPA